MGAGVGTSLFDRRILASSVLLLAFVPAADAADRAVLYEREFAEDFVANEQAYLVIVVPEGFSDLRFEVACGLSVGTVVLYGSSGDSYDAACALATSQNNAAVGPGYYYGVASFSGLNGATLRLTGTPS